jgi:hypothetical protein
MQKAIILTFLTLCTFAVNAQKLSTGKVPSPVKYGLTKAHPGITAKWEWEDANYEANFKENGKSISCVLDKTGTILETETEIVQSELPKTVNTYVSNHYKGKKIKEIASIRKANGEVNYEVAVSGKELIFDQSGNLTNGK